MKLRHAQLSIAASWVGLLISAALILFKNQYVGCAIGLVSIVLLRAPYVNEAKSFVQFTNAKPTLAYGLAGIAAASSIWLFVESIRRDALNPTITDNIFVDKYMWVPIGFWILLIAAHEIWLFPKLKDEPDAKP